MTLFVDIVAAHEVVNSFIGYFFCAIAFFRASVVVRRRQITFFVVYYTNEILSPVFDHKEISYAQCISP